MKKSIVLSILGMFCMVLSAHASFGEIQGKILDENGQPMIGAGVFAVAGEKEIGTMSDLDGKYKIKPLQSGVYTINITFTGYRKVQVQNVEVKPDQITFNKDIQMEMEAYLIDGEGPMVIYDATKRINPEETGMTSIGADEIEHHPQRKDIVSFISTMSTDIKTNDQGQLYVRGARPTAIVYFVDGMKIYGQFRNLPSSGIGSISVYTGGVPAKYGDTTGGVVVIESKNYFDLYNQWYYSQN